MLSKPLLHYAFRRKEYIMDENDSSKLKERNYGSMVLDDSPQEEHDVDIDNAFQLVGKFGRFQICLYIIASYLVLTIGYHFVAGFFMGDEPPWRCVAKNSSSFCMLYFGKDISKEDESFNRRCDLKRYEWEYSSSKLYSFLTEFDLVCEKAAMVAMIRASFFIGGLIGSLISGLLADTFGRKLVILVSLMIVICFSIACTFSRSVLQLCILRGIIGSAHVACFFTMFVHLSEFAAPKHRALTANMYIMSLTSSFLLIDLLAYFERQWRKLQLYASFPSILALITFYFIPESPRWLLATNKRIQATTVLENIALFNGKPPMVIHLEELPYEKKYSYIDLISSFKVLSLTAVTGILWATTSLVYYTTSLESSSLGGDMYQTFALLAIADFPSYMLSPFICNRYGRKTTILVCLTTAGLLLGAMSLVPLSLTYRYKIIIVMVILSKFFICLSFTGMYPWSFEMFPTVLRSQGISTCVIFERLGLIAVPFLTTVLQRLYYNAPFIFMCALAIFSSSIGLILPETNKKKTREKYEDFF